jgi:hypothetical protein
MTTKYIVNNASGQTINGDLTVNGNVVITGTTDIRPYKVFTALVTQRGSGGDTDFINGGELTIGVTYYINDNFNGDFTNVGAPNNNNGTYFVATGTTPNTWGVSILGAEILTFVPDAPVAIVLENTIGNIGFAYGLEGVYIISCKSLFIEDKSWYTPVITSDRKNGSMEWRSENEIRIVTVLDGVLTDGLLSRTPIEIRVYN